MLSRRWRIEKLLGMALGRTLRLSAACSDQASEHRLHDVSYLVAQATSDEDAADYGKSKPFAAPANLQAQVQVQHAQQQAWQVQQLAQAQTQEITKILPYIFCTLLTQHRPMLAQQVYKVLSPF